MLDDLVSWKPPAAVVVGSFTSWLAYCSAVGLAERISALASAAVDVHARELYAKFGIRAPRNREEEKAAGSAITEFITRGQPIDDALREATQVAVRSGLAAAALSALRGRVSR